MTRFRLFARHVVLPALLVLVAAGPAAAATPVQLLPTGSELGGRWHSNGSSTIDPAKSQSIPAEFKMSVSAAFVVGPVVGRIFLSQRAPHYPSVAATRAVAHRFAAKVAANP